MNLKQKIKKGPISTTAWNQRKRRLEKHTKESMSHFVKESAEKLTILNEDTDFVYQYSPAEIN